MAVGDPTGADLTSGTTNGDTLPGEPTYEEREITFDAPYSLVSGSKYAIVVRCTNALLSLVWNTSAPGTSYSSDDSGSTWAAQGTSAWFKVKATGVEKDTQTFSDSDGVALSSITWWADTFTTSSAYAVTSVVLKLATFSGRSPGTATVSIREVEGETYFNPPVSTASNNMLTNRRLVACAQNKFWYEDA